MTLSPADLDRAARAAAAAPHPLSGRQKTSLRAILAGCTASRPAAMSGARAGAGGDARGGEAA